MHDWMQKTSWQGHLCWHFNKLPWKCWIHLVHRTLTSLDKSWLNAKCGKEHVNLLSHKVQLDLTSFWVEACNKGEWEHFVNHRVLHSSDHSLHHISKQTLCSLTSGWNSHCGVWQGKSLCSSMWWPRSRCVHGQPKYYICFHILCPPATEKSWGFPFQGNAARGLWEHIETHYNPLDYRVYAHYAAIIQYSGMGKSRTVDELAKDHFIVPLNLQEATSTGACGLCLGYFNMC